LDIPGPTIAVGTFLLTAALSIPALGGFQPTMVAVFFGLPIRKKKKYYGIIYDGSNYNPIPFAVITVKLSSNQIIEQTVTDLEGRYSLTLDKGEFIVEAKSAGFNSEKKRVEIEEGRLVQDFVLSKTGERINPIRKSFIENRGSFVNNLIRINLLFMIVGAIYSLYAYINTPSIYNAFVLGLYSLFILFLTFSTFRVISRKKGKVVDSQSKDGLSNAIIRLMDRYKNPVDIAVSGANGNISFTVKAGRYHASGYKEGYDAIRNRELNLKSDNTLDRNIDMKKSPLGATPFGG
jgi:hypothetical protein